MVSPIAEFLSMSYNLNKFLLRNNDDYEFDFLLFIAASTNFTNKG